MKNQYFGDVNDYRKYGLLRALSAAGKISIGVCWMLTPSGGRTDGQKLRYLDRFGDYRGFDPGLFDRLLRFVKVEGERDVRRVEDVTILPETIFYTALLGQSASERRRYFSEMLERFRDVDLIFFDPDNGFEVTSKPLGRNGSNKYLYWHELAEAYYAGHSVLVYQHFARSERASFIARKAEEVRSRTGADSVCSFRTSDVVFLLAAQPAHQDHFDRQTRHSLTTWGKQISVWTHQEGQPS